MTVDALLARPGLEPRVRTLVGGVVAVWRGDWAALCAWIDAARGRGQARADFEEALLQAVLFCGFPRAVTAFEQLEQRWPAAAPPAGGGLPAAEQPRAGRELFAGVYGRNGAAVEAMLRGFHADFHAFVLDVAYGRVLARPHLPPRERELLAIALLAAQDQPRQFAGHARGAVSFGATDAELREALWTVFADDATVETWLRRR
jgi:alkylhydroperoxidase/carboxymuconolactone decarboxylase family protein YurZ